MERKESVFGHIPFEMFRGRVVVVDEFLGTCGDFIIREFLSAEGEGEASVVAFGKPTKFYRELGAAGTVLSSVDTTLGKEDVEKCLDRSQLVVIDDWNSRNVEDLVAGELGGKRTVVIVSRNVEESNWKEAYGAGIRVRTERLSPNAMLRFDGVVKISSRHPLWAATLFYHGGRHVEYTAG